MSAMSRRCASASRERMVPVLQPFEGATPSGNAENLNAQGTRTGTVELRHQNPLPLSEHDLAAADLQGQVMAKEKRSQMRVSVHPVAVRVLRIVVQPPV